MEFNKKIIKKLTKKRMGIIALAGFVLFVAWLFFRDHGEETAPQPVIPVTTTVVTARELDSTENVVGVLSSLSTPVIRAETSGRVTKLFVDLGLMVNKGQVLAELDPTDQTYAASNNASRVAQLEADRDNMQLTVERYRKLAASQYVSQADLDKAESNLRNIKAQILGAKAQSEQANYQMARTQILAPITGQIQRRDISVGDYIAVGAPLFQIVEVAILRATLPFPETIYQRIKIGQTVHLTVPADRQQVITAKITQLVPVIDGNNRSINAISDFNNTNNWQPGGSVEGEVIIQHNPSAIMVPIECVVNRPNGMVVYIIMHNKAIERKVVTGQIKDDWIEIKNGLAVGEVIAQNGAGYLTDKTTVKVVP